MALKAEGSLPGDPRPPGPEGTWRRYIGAEGAPPPGPAHGPRLPALALPLALLLRDAVLGMGNF